ALSPRQPVTATPYSIKANSANSLSGALPAAQLTGFVPHALLSTNIPRLNSNLVVSGAVQILNSSSTFNGTFIGDGSGLRNIVNLPAPGWIWRQMPVPALMLSTFVNSGCNNSESLVVTNILNAKTNGMWAAGWRTVLV